MIAVNPKHTVNGNPTQPPFPENTEMTIFGMGCFWGVERKFWNTKGVYSTHVGYSAGKTKNPSYEEVCTGSTIIQLKECGKGMTGERSIDRGYIIIQTSIGH